MTPATFRDDEQRELFTRLVWQTYSHCLKTVEQAGVITGDPELASLTGLLVNRMLQYKHDRACDLAEGGHAYVAALEPAMNEIWPRLEALLEQELAEAGQMVKEMRAERKKNLN